jgi:hypothetical protein
MSFRTLELWRWRVTDPDSGRRYVVPCGLTQADALELDPAAERVPGSLELRQVDDDPRAYLTTPTSAQDRPLPGRSTAR